MRIGIGYDVHQLVKCRKLILGGVEVPYERGLLGHSDADVLIHAIEDAILGALALGDIGKLFPDTDPAYKDASSMGMFKKVMAIVKEKGYAVGNIDATVIAQKPKLAPYIPAMRENIAAVCEKDVSAISVKATTSEKMGYEGRGEGMTAMAVVLLEPTEEKDDKMLVTGKQILQHADEHGYAVGAFNVNNMEIIQAIAQAADDLRAPVILQASQGAIKYAGVDYITSLVKTTAERIDVPMTLHLDHGTDFEEIMKCIRSGFTSVMIDASKHELDENIRLTKEIVRIAHSVGVSVEAEIGKIGGTEDQIVVSDAEATYTDPEEARIFVEETGVDSLAIAVGTARRL